MTEAPFHRITRTEVKLDIVKTEKDTLVVCHCPYCDDFIIGKVIPDIMHPFDGPIIKVKTKCEHFEQTQEWLRTHPQHTGGVEIDLEDIFQHASLDDLARDLDWCSKLQIKRICLEAARDMYEWARRTNNQEMLAWSEKYWEENK